MKPKILVVDDHEAARVGISNLLVADGFDVAAMASNGREAEQVVANQMFDAVVIDVRMAGGDGLSALELIRQRCSELPVVVYSAYENPTYIARAAALGASDYVLKNGATHGIGESLQRAVRGEAPSSKSRLAQIRRKLKREADVSRLPADFPLTGREAQVLVHIALGLSNKEIAHSLEISVVTAKEHVQNTLRKLKATDRTRAAVWAIRSGLVD